MATVASRAERFSGFSDEAIQFFLELQAEQNRTWFKAHQDDFLRLCRRPLELFVGELQERLVEVYPGRTRHIHVKVQAPGGPTLTTQLYFPGEARNNTDGIFDPSLVLNVQNNADGTEAATFNFVVQTA